MPSLLIDSTVMLKDGHLKILLKDGYLVQELIFELFVFVLELPPGHVSLPHLRRWLIFFLDTASCRLLVSSLAPMSSDALPDEFTASTFSFAIIWAFLVISSIVTQGRNPCTLRAIVILHMLEHEDPTLVRATSCRQLLCRHLCVWLKIRRDVLFWVLSLALDQNVALLRHFKLLYGVLTAHIKKGRGSIVNELVRVGCQRLEQSVLAHASRLEFVVVGLVGWAVVFAAVPSSTGWGISDAAISVSIAVYQVEMLTQVVCIGRRLRGFFDRVRAGPWTYHIHCIYLIEEHIWPRVSMLDNPRLVHWAFVTLFIIYLGKLAEKTRLVYYTLVLLILRSVLLVLNVYINAVSGCWWGQFFIKIAETSNATIWVYMLFIGFWVCGIWPWQCSVDLAVELLCHPKKSLAILCVASLKRWGR